MTDNPELEALQAREMEARAAFRAASDAMTASRLEWEAAYNALARHNGWDEL